MIGRALDSNNDIIVSKGSFATVEEAAETVQHVRTRLQFYLSEWFLNQNSGVPYFEKIFTKPANLNNVESIIKTKILQTPGVEALLEFSMEYSGASERKLSISFSADTIYGTINSEEVTINV